MTLGTPEQESATLDISSNNATTQDTEQSVNWEKRFKDTQAAYTQSRQELVAIKAELEVLKKPVQLSAEEKDALEDLKYTDPEAWRKRVNDMDKEQEVALSAKRQELTELEQRQLAFEEFAHSHPDVVINDDVLAYDVPKRITNKLEKGEITFEAFLGEVYEYLKKPKAVGDVNKTSSQPDLSKLGGNSAASASATAADIVQSYKNEVY